jgi:hypothetical protein
MISETLIDKPVDDTDYGAPEKFKCDLCEDTGIVTRDEWTGTDDSYEVEKECKCQED